MGNLVLGDKKNQQTTAGSINLHLISGFDIRTNYSITRSEFNDVSAVERSLYWCQVLDIMNKDRYWNSKRTRTLALLNHPSEPFDVI